MVLTIGTQIDWCCAADLVSHASHFYCFHSDSSTLLTVNAAVNYELLMQGQQSTHLIKHLLYVLHQCRIYVDVLRATYTVIFFRPYSIKKVTWTTRSPSLALKRKSLRQPGWFTAQQASSTNSLSRFSFTVTKSQIIDFSPVQFILFVFTVLFMPPEVWMH